MYEFTERAGDIEALLLETFDDKFMLPGSNPDEVVYFQNGDRMTVNLKNGIMQFDGINPANCTSSRLNWKRHKWFSEGIIREIQPAEQAC